MRDPDPASGLLDVTNRAELEDFVRGLVRRSGERLPAHAGRALVDVLTTTAVRTVPTLHALVGAGTPPAPRVYGLALEGMSVEDRDFELARQFVRFARAAADRVARNPADDIGTAVGKAAREFAPGLAHPAGPAGKESRMFQTETQTAQYEGAEYGRRRRRRGRWADDDEAGQGGYGEYEAEWEQPGYETTGYEQPGYEQQGYEQSGYEQSGYGEAEYEQGGYGEAEHGGYGQGEDEESEEERFLPLIPIAGKVLGGLLGGLLKEEEGEGSYYEEEEGEAGEAEEAFLGKLLKKVLGQEAEHDETALSPAQEAEFAGQMLEINSEEELDEFLGKLVNFVGKAVQGVRRAANSPQGRALIEAVKPLARAALPTIGGAIGGAIAPGVGSQVGQALGTAASTLFETESSMMSEEEEEFENARRFVRLASAAAQDVACAPPGAPPRMVGEFGVIRASRRFARPLFRRSLRRISPLARRFFGSRYRGFRRGFRSGPSFRRFPFRGPRFGLRPRFGYGFPAGPGPEPEPVPVAGPAPEPPPGPPQPGYRWVAVPIGAPDPVPAAPAEPPPPPGEPAPAAQSEYGYGANGHGNGHGGGRWVRRNGKIVVLGA